MKQGTVEHTGTVPVCLIFLLTNSTAIEYNFIKIKSHCESRADLSLSTSEPVCTSFREIAYRLILFAK